MGSGSLPVRVRVKKRRRPQLHRDVGDDPAIRDHRLGDLAGRAARPGPRSPTARRGRAGRSPRDCATSARGDRRGRRVVAAEALDPQARPDARTEVARPARGGRSAASSATVVMPSPARRCAVRSPMPQIAVTGRSPMVGSHSSRVSVAMPPGLANPVAVLAWSFVSPMPTAQESSVAVAHRLPARPGRGRAGSSVVGAEERLVPPQHLDHDGQRAQGGHHLGGGGVVGRVVGREGTPRRGNVARAVIERHARVHAEGACLVGRGGHHLARPGGVTVAADDHRPPGELGPAPHLHGREELVEVHVQDPRVGGHRDQPCRLPV